MKLRYMAWTVVGGAVLMSGIFFLNSENKKVTLSNPVPAPAASSTNSSKNSVLSEYTLADVALHGSSSSCWTSIDGRVYDVTEWISKHPGGEAAIRSLCGVDGTALFNGQHEGQRRPARELESFSIGTLKE